MGRVMKRGAGILMHISSLPSPYGIGTFGKAAYEFADRLAEAGQTYWQVLPVGPTGYGDSPYQSFSSFAGNPYFIDIDMLIKDGFLKKDDVDRHDFGSDPGFVDYGRVFENRFRLLEAAYKKSSDTEEFNQFCMENQWWLDDYALFMALKERFNNRSWLEWNYDIRMMELEAVEHYKELLKERLDFWRFCQFQFFSQWKRLKDYVNRKGILIMGDIPIYAALDSADVWANSRLFQLDGKKRPVCVAGVPPDSFSSKGQLWGAPLYNWEGMEKDGFAWWKSRIKHCAGIYDALRIDHFIGISRYYSIPAGNKDAACGEWKDGPGRKLTNVFDEAAGDKIIIAEDLGMRHPSVVQLLKETGYLGMRVMLFGFDGNPDNEHLSKNFKDNMVAYGGTHDNETIVGAFKNSSNDEIRYVLEYLNISAKEQIPWAMIETAYASPARVVIFQMQDILELDNSARMNTPSTLEGNWCWRMRRGQFTRDRIERLRKLTEKYGR